MNNFYSMLEDKTYDDEKIALISNKVNKMFDKEIA